MKTLSGTILVADDDADIREILRDTLNSLGARIVTAVDGQDCLDRVEADVPDVVLLDIEMPVKSGLQVLQDLRRRGSEMTIIMITAYGTIERAVQAMKQGAYDFITKPFDLDHITLVVEKALERERLKRGLEHFSEETGERYRLIGGKAQRCARPSKQPEKPRQADPRYCCSARAAREKRSLPARFTNGATGEEKHSSRLTV
jgi:DNA-binding NtrC family response regulator